MGLNVQEIIDTKIDDVGYEFYETTTVCFIKSKCGAIFVGESHCFDINDYKIKVGQDEAYKNALGKLIEAEAYHRKCINKMLSEFESKKPEPPKTGGVKLA